jgi:hypothetical protein
MKIGPLVGTNMGGLVVYGIPAIMDGGGIAPRGGFF